MFATKPIKILMELAVLSIAVLFGVWSNYWPDMHNEAVGVLCGLAFLSGGCATAAYILIRYRHELTTPQEVAE